MCRQNTHTTKSPPRGGGIHSNLAKTEQQNLSTAHRSPTVACIEGRGQKPQNCPILLPNLQLNLVETDQLHNHFNSQLITGGNLDFKMPALNASDDHLPPPLLNHGRALAHHKLGPGVVALHSSAFQEMDEYAPYRIAFLLLLIVSSVVLWASYKLICEREGTEEDESAVLGGAVYRPLSHQPTTDGGDVWLAEFGAGEEENGDDGTSLCSHETGDFLWQMN